MQYISFYKNRLPFKPKTNVVIYFDAMDIGVKKYYEILYEHYNMLVEAFRHGGLEFCFLPMIAHDMDIGKNIDRLVGFGLSGKTEEQKQSRKSLKEVYAHLFD
jgi:hypothetical protein